MAHILVVEDHKDLAFGLERALTSRGHRVTIAGDGESAVTYATTATPDLMVLDLALPRLDGFSVLERVRAAGVGVPTLILSARGEEMDKVRGLRLGADDYVTKPFGLLELLERVEALLRRAAGTGRPAAVQRFGDVTVDLFSKSVTRRGEPVALTPMEFALLQAFLRHPEEALSRPRLLRDVWGHAPDVRTRTVDIHVAELRRKLEDTPATPRHFITVWKTGYRFAP